MRYSGAMTETKLPLASRAIQRSLFAARWLMAPVYLCMAVVLALLVVKFFQELAHAVPTVLEMSETQLIATTLTLVDLTLVANLIAMVTLVGYENFVGRLNAQADAFPTWLAHTDLMGLKQKVITSIISIAAIDLLKRYLDVSNAPRGDLQIQTIVFLAFVVAGTLLALMDRLSTHKE